MPVCPPGCVCVCVCGWVSDAMRLGRMALCPDLLAVSDCTVYIGNRLPAYDWTLGLSLTGFMLQRQSIQMADESQDTGDYEVRLSTAAFARA